LGYAKYKITKNLQPKCDFSEKKERGLPWLIAMATGWGSEGRRFKTRRPSRQPMTPRVATKIQKNRFPVRKKRLHDFDSLDVPQKNIVRWASSLSCFRKKYLFITIREKKEFKDLLGVKIEHI